MPKPDAKKRMKRNPSTVNEAPFAFKKVLDPITGTYALKRVVSPQISDEILSTGNVNVLEDFYNQNEANLTAADKKYLNAKLHTARKIEEFRKNALVNIGKGKAPYKTKCNVRYARNNNSKEKKPEYVSLPEIKSDKVQSSANGCWSYGLSLMLKSKGINLSQEEIRAFRPDYKPGMNDRKMTDNRMMLQEYDTTNSAYENADLLLSVLPNHYVEQYTFNPYNNEATYFDQEIQDYKSNFSGISEAEKKKMGVNNAVIQRENQIKNDVRNAFLVKAKTDMKNIFFKSIYEEHCPVLVNYSGSHYVTVTGIDLKTGMLDVADSRADKNTGSTSKKIRIDDLILDKLSNAGGLSSGITLTVLKEIKVPEYSAKGQIDTTKSIYNKEGEVVNLQDKMDMSAEVKKGFVRGQSTNTLEFLDYSKIRSLSKYKNLQQGDNEISFYGQVDRYYPKNVQFKRDPSINTKTKVNTIFNNERNTVYDALDQERQQKQEPPNPEPNSFGYLINFCKDAINKQKKTDFPVLSCLYATYKYIEKEKISEQELNTRRLTPEDKATIGAMIRKCDPLLKTYIGLNNYIKLNSKDMNYLAVHGTQKEFTDCVKEHCSQVIPTSSKRMTNEKKQQVVNELSRACTELEKTGTGKNYFGMERSKNTGKYDKMLNALRTYISNDRRDSFDTYNLKQTCLDYISDKYKVRSTPTGKKRFEQTMRILKNIMHKHEYDKLVKKINSARELTGKVGDPNYITSSSFTKETGRDIIQNVTECINHKPDEETVKGMLSVMIATHEKAEGNMGKVLIDPDAADNSKEELFKRAKEIRSTRSFTNLMNRIFPYGVEPATSGNILVNYIQNEGREIFNAFRTYEAQQNMRNRRNVSI